MTQDAKSAAEMYALGSISVEQVLDFCQDLDDAKQALEYAKDYGAEYDFWVERMRRKNYQIKEAWAEYENNITNDEYYLDAKSLLLLQEDIQREDRLNALNGPWPNLGYTDEQLQKYYDNWNESRRLQLERIAMSAKDKKIPEPLVNKFFNYYHLDNAERTRFWLYYNGFIRPKTK